MKAKKAVVFGCGAFAELVFYYLTHDSEYEVSAFTASDNLVDSKIFLGKPLVCFSDLEREYPPEEYDIFIAVGYVKLNKLREKFMNEAKAKGYKLLSYVSSKATTWPGLQLGENCFIFEDNTLQPFISIEAGSILWSGNHIGHHSHIGPYTFISSHVVISGFCDIGSHCFIGVNATIADGVKVANFNLIGPGAIIKKSTKIHDAYLPERTTLYPKSSGRFFK